MSKLVKSLVQEDLHERYKGFSSACVVELTGLTVHEQERLRAMLREKSAKLEVVKNSMARRAFQDTGLEPLGPALVGPCAVVTSEQSLIDIARTLVDASKEFAKLKLKDAVFDGDRVLMSVIDLAKMRGRVEILGEVAMLISSPGRALAGALRSPQSKIAGCLKALIEKAGGAEDASPEAA